MIIKKLAIIVLFFIGISAGLFFYLTNDSYSLPVLMYHQVSDKKWDDAMFVSRDEFARQVKYLKDNNYKFLSLEEVEDYKVHKRKFPRKCVAITFDDGYDSVYRNAYPVLKDYGAKGTVFIITSKTNEKGYLSSNQILEMQKSGVIKSESHTDNHLQLPKLVYEKQLSELRDSKQKLEQLLGSKVNYIAYPYGESNEDTEKAMKEVGYNIGFRVDSDYTRVWQNNYGLNRFWALEDFKYFTQITKISRVSDLRFYLKRIRNGALKQDKKAI